MANLFTTTSLYLLLLFLAAPVPLAYAADAIVVRVSENGYPATHRLNDKWVGMDIEILNEILLRAKIDYRLVDRPFQRSLFQMKDGSVHVIPNLVKNNQRSEYMDWIGPTRITCIGLVVQEQDKTLDFSTTDELMALAKSRQQKLGYLTGASYSAYFDRRMENDEALRGTLYFLPSNDQHRQMLKLGRLMGYFFDAFEIRQRMADTRFARQYEGLALHPYTIEESCIGAYIGLSKKLAPETSEKLQNAFESMTDDESFSAIHQKWMGKKPDF